MQFLDWKKAEFLDQNFTFFHVSGQCETPKKTMKTSDESQEETAPVIDKSDQKTSSHVCEICDKSFCKKKNLRKHLYQVHKMRRKTCNICGKSCNNLETHMDKFHNNGRKTCNICGILISRVFP